MSITAFILPCVVLLLPCVWATSVRELRDSFYMDVEETQTMLRQKTGAILYQSDLMEFWSVMGGSETTLSINSTIFTNFTAIAHAPVSVATIILPDLLSGKSGIGTTTRRRLQNFREVLLVANIVFADSDQQAVADSILESVSKFTDEILNNKSVVDMQLVENFARGLEAPMRRAAEMAVKDYFVRLVQLAKGLNIAFNWSVVLSVDEFSHEGSFLHQFYKKVFFQVLYGSQAPYVGKRIVLLPNGLCNSNTSALTDQLNGIASNQIYRNTTNNIFNYGDSIHGILADAANKVICSGSLEGVSVECPVEITFPGFDTIWDRVYVIFIVTLFSVALFLLILLISIFSEDRIVKMENSDKPKKKIKKFKKKKSEQNSQYFGPHLLEPIGSAECTSAYVTYRDLKKKHSGTNIAPNGRLSHGDVSNDGDSDVSQGESDSPSHDYDSVVLDQRPRGVTRTEVTLENMAEC